jgi:anti-anti-sigma factor
VIEVDGVLGPDVTDVLRDAVEGQFRAGCRRFVFDLSGLRHVGSLGLREFVALASRVKGDGVVCVCELQPGVQSVFEVSRLTKLISLCGSRLEAIAAARSA